MLKHDVILGIWFRFHMFNPAIPSPCLVCDSVHLCVTRHSRCLLAVAPSRSILLSLGFLSCMEKNKVLAHKMFIERDEEFPLRLAICAWIHSFRTMFHSMTNQGQSLLISKKNWIRPSLGLFHLVPHVKCESPLHNLFSVEW